MLGEIARLRDRLREPHEHGAEREIRDWIWDAEQVVAVFMRSPTFQAAVRHHLNMLAPVWERIDARQCDDPESRIIKVRAQQQRHNLESLLISGDAAPAAQASAVLLAESAIADEQADAASLPTNIADAEMKAAAVLPTEADGAVKRKRTDNLKRAIFDAWDKGLPLNASATDVFDHLVRRDDTNYVRGRDGDELQWENSSGGLSRTMLKALSNRLPSCREEYKTRK